MIRKELLNTLRGHTCEHCARGMVLLRSLLEDAVDDNCADVVIPTIALRWLVDYVDAHMPEVPRGEAN